MQADDLTVIKKYKEYVVIKRSLTQCYSRMKCFTYLTLLISIAMLVAEIFDLINMDNEPFLLQILNMETNKDMDMTAGIFIASLMLTMVLSVVYFVIAIVGMQVVSAKDVNSLDCMIATLKFSSGTVAVLLLSQYTMAIIFFLSFESRDISDMLLYLA